MKTLIALSLVLFTHSALAADFNETCMNRYRDASYSLIDQAHSLNNGDIGSAQFLAEYALIESKIGATRLICAFESDDVKNCVQIYKNQYHKLRSNIDVAEIAKGNQTKVRVALVEAGLVVSDLRCQ